MNKKKSILLSIVTITKDDKNGLKDTINSINGNNFVELIVIDGSIKSLINKEFLKKNTNLNHVKYLKQKTSGIFNAMNEGLKNAQGKYIIFMNGGDKFYKDFECIRNFKIFENNYDLIIFQTKIQSKFLKRSIGINPPYMKIKNNNYKILINLFPNIFWPSHQSCFFKTSVHKKYNYDQSVIGSDQKVIKFFMQKNFKLINSICSVTDTSGVSSVPPKNFKNFKSQIRDSLKLNQYMRILKLIILFGFRVIFTPKNLDSLRCLKYNIVEFIIKFCKMINFVINLK